MTAPSTCENPAPEASSCVQLRPYQHEALAAIEAAEQRGIRRPLVALPTGTGKTILFSALIASRPGRALVLAHRDELIRQAHEKITAVMPGIDVGIIKAERNEFDRPVVLASVQTLARANRLAQLPNDFATIIIDEAHHAAADSYKRVLEHVGSFAADGPLTVGMTATPERADRKQLADVWDRIVYQRSLLEMIEAQYLVDLRGRRVGIAADFAKLHTRAGDFIERELEEALLDANAPKVAATAYAEHAADRSGLVFVPTVKVAHEMAAAFCDYGIAAEALDASTPLHERRAMLRRLATGETRAITNCAVLTEGFDESSIGCIVIARPTRSRVLYTQMIGRGTRRHPGKHDCLILDLTGATARHDLLTLSSLFGLKNGELKEHSVGEAVAARRERDRVGVVDGRMITRAVDLFSRRHRSMNWLLVGDEHYVLALGEGAHLELARTADGFEVGVLKRGEPKHVLAHSPTLEYAQGIAEDHARRTGVGTIADPEAPWRTHPASQKQLQALRKRPEHT